jgi:hypothetical protein
VAANQSISRDGKQKGDYVMRGMEPKADSKTTPPTDELPPLLVVP